MSSIDHSITEKLREDRDFYLKKLDEIASTLSGTDLNKAPKKIKYVCKLLVETGVGFVEAKCDEQGSRTFYSKI